MNFSKERLRKMSINFNYNYPQLAREAGFRLRQYKDGPLDWRLLGSFEIERLLRDQSIEDIDKALLHLSEAPLGSVLLDTNILDPAIAKYFIVSQFAIQYLLFCRNFLDETIQELRESHAESQMDLARHKKLLTEANNEILQLHKKMTQMEAIHEVIYPCHLCTKNFANNEALNIHIGRKHATTKNKIETTPVSGASKGRHSDLTLINTIKLELEIKQLKERLNNAEKEIKERQSNQQQQQDESKIMDKEIASRTTTPPKKNPSTETRNVAIQSNLSEEKEKNDAKEDDDDIEKSRENIAERKAQLEKLQTKIYEFEEWRATQMANNEDSITEINRKLTDIAHALDEKKHHAQSENDNYSTDIKNREEDERRRRLSVEDLERVLSEKVAEIGKASSEKLEAIVHNMETNYREKLIELEREVKRSQHDSADIVLEKIRMESMQSKVRKIRKAEDDRPNNKAEDIDENDGTYNIEIVKELPASKPKLAAAQATISNQTFVVSLEAKDEARDLPQEESVSDDTNISESLTDDEPSYDVEPTKPLESIEVREREKDKRRKDNEIPKVKSPRKYTRKDAKLMANKRLSKYGFDMRMKSIPNAALKSINIELNQNRNKWKQKYPNYYATRNRIKKFVDKICTTKSTEKAEKILTTMPTLQPMKAPKRFQKQLSTQNEPDEDDDCDGDDDNEHEELEKNVQEKIASSEDFKKRLERLLASPVQRPRMSAANATNTIVQVHSELPPPMTAPMPMPRKRVMFNTTVVGKEAGAGDIIEIKDS